MYRRNTTEASSHVEEIVRVKQLSAVNFNICFFCDKTAKTVIHTCSIATDLTLISMHDHE